MSKQIVEDLNLNSHLSVKTPVLARIRYNKVEEILQYFKYEKAKKSKTISKLLKTKHFFKNSTLSSISINYRIKYRRHSAQVL